jgi:cobalamin biosynthesis Mg chelatase CobN
MSDEQNTKKYENKEDESVVESNKSEVKPSGNNSEEASESVDNHSETKADSAEGETVSNSGGVSEKTSDAEVETDDGTKEESESEKEVEDKSQDEFLNYEYDMDEEEEFNGEDPSLNLWERFVRFEGDTKTGIITGLVLLVSILFNWQWINYTWWIVLILAGVSLRYLNKQRVELEEEKPFESKVSNTFFIVVIILLIIRDLVVTSKLNFLVDNLPQ